MVLSERERQDEPTDDEEQLDAEPAGMKEVRHKLLEAGAQMRPRRIGREEGVVRVERYDSGDGHKTKAVDLGDELTGRRDARERAQDATTDPIQNRRF